MITWLELALCLPVVMTIFLHWKEEGAMANHVAASVVVIIYLVPAIYVFGWLLLPAWGLAPSMKGF